MRWVPFLFATYVLMLLQVSLGGKMLTFTTEWIGPVGPDLTAIFAVFVALFARHAVDALMAGWVLGLSVDLLAAGGVAGGTCPGVLSLTYMAAAGAVFWVREAFFRDRPLTQAILGLLFCLVAYGLWVVAQAALAGDWGSLRRLLPQMLALALYTAVLTPLVHLLLVRMRRWFVTAPAGEGHGRRERW